MKADKLLQKIIIGQVQNVPFADLCLLLRKLGFAERQKEATVSSLTKTWLRS